MLMLTPFPAINESINAQLFCDVLCTAAANNLLGTIPTTIGSLSGLQVIELSKSRRKPRFSLAVFYATHQQLLSFLLGAFLLGDNALTNFPSEITGLNNLRILNLSKNQVGGSIYTEIGNLKTLQELLLHSNPIGGTLPTELGVLGPLGVLDVSNTGIAGEIPLQIAILPSLTTIRVQGTNITGNLDLLFCTAQFEDVAANCLNNPDVLCSCCSECCDAVGENCEQY
jgi:hypothetical protein